MSFLLCHDCYTWVEPQDDRCSECLQLMDFSAVDPPAWQLQNVMGELIERLGEVRIPRRLLPEWGTLFATTQGLFFVPHETDYVAVTEAAFPPQSLLWSVGTLLWSPLLLLMPFMSGGSEQEISQRILRPRYLDEHQLANLPELLMSNPGAFFVPKRHIQSLAHKRTRWFIERNLGSPLHFTPVAPARAFHEKFSELIKSPAWRTINTSG